MDIAEILRRCERAKVITPSIAVFDLAEAVHALALRVEQLERERNEARKEHRPVLYHHQTEGTNQ